MKKNLTLNTRYILRKKRNDQYIIIDTVVRKIHTINYSLFFILNLFKCKSISLEELKSSFENKGLLDTYNSFIPFLMEFPNLLIETSDIKKNVNNYYSNRNRISPFTDYSPERIDFLITHFCNLKCKHCFEESSNALCKPQPYDLDIVKQLFDQMDYMNVKTLKITGGEPLTIPNFKDIIKLSLQYRFDCMILTNGTLLTDELIDIFKQKNVVLGLSLDGKDRETHEILRGKGSYYPLVRNLEKLKRANIIFSITTTIFNSNKNQIEDITDRVFNDYGGQSIIINMLKPLGRAIDNNNIFLDGESEQNIKEVIVSITGKYNNRIMLSDDSELSSDIDTQESITCAAGNKILAIDNNFNIYPCIYGINSKNYLLGSFPANSLVDCWYSDKLEIFRGKTQLNDLEKCKNCVFNIRCIAKNCRLKPVYQGKTFYSPISYCQNGKQHVFVKTA